MAQQQDSYGNYLVNMGPAPANLLPQVTFITTLPGNPNSLGFVSIVYPALVYDYANNFLYASTDGSTWVQIPGGAGGTTQVFTGLVPPIAVPTNPAVFYNQSDGDFYVWYTSTNTWEKLINF